MTWRVAQSLLVLREQINTAWPNRSKASDGTIGDPAHRAEGSGSDHNPNHAGVVCALDVTHDPANGVDIDKLSDALAASKDPRIKYIIANGMILVPPDYGWVWKPYNGANPHTSHMHISVYGNYDNPAKWNIGKENEMVTEKDFEYWSKAVAPLIIGEEWPRSEFNKSVGKTDKETLTRLFMSPKAAAFQSYQNIGKRAVSEKWEQKVAEVNKSEAVKRLNAVKAKVDELEKLLG
jgi:hypothetical protein